MSHSIFHCNYLSLPAGLYSSVYGIFINTAMAVGMWRKLGTTSLLFISRFAVSTLKISINLVYTAFIQNSMPMMTGYSHTVYPKKYAHGFCFAVLCCGYTLNDFPKSIRLTSLANCGNLTIVPVPAKQPWWIWINTSCEFIMNYCITTTKQSTTKPCAYFLGYTVTPNVSDTVDLTIYHQNYTAKSLI